MESNEFLFSEVVGALQETSRELFGLRKPQLQPGAAGIRAAALSGGAVGA